MDLQQSIIANPTVIIKFTEADVEFRSGGSQCSNEKYDTSQLYGVTKISFGVENKVFVNLKLVSFA